jgi:hypothetical protein
LPVWLGEAGPKVTDSVLVTIFSGEMNWISIVWRSTPGGVSFSGDSFGTSSRPDRVANSNDIAERTRLRWFNTAAFANVPNGVVRPESSPRGALFDPG